MRNDNKALNIDEEQTAGKKEEKRGAKRRHISGLHSRPLHAIRSCAPSTCSRSFAHGVRALYVLTQRTGAYSAAIFTHTNSNDTDDVAPHPLTAADIHSRSTPLARVMHYTRVLLRLGRVIHR